jgi:hypothetical protein
MFFCQSDYCSSDRRLLPGAENSVAFLSFRATLGSDLTKLLKNSCPSSVIKATIMIARLEIPDASLSATAVQSVEEEARDDNTKEAAERCAESGTFPTRSDSDGQAVSMIVR